MTSLWEKVKDGFLYLTMKDEWLEDRQRRMVEDRLRLARTLREFDTEWERAFGEPGPFTDKMGQPREGIGTEELLLRTMELLVRISKDQGSW